MAIHVQRWVPDTCQSPATGDACSILEEWDDSVDPITRTHTLKTVEKVCSLHAGVAGLTLFTRLYDENRRKNVSWSIAQSVKATLILSQFVWSYNSVGVLLVNFGSALTTNQKTQVQNACDIQFGAGKVLVS